MTLREKIVEIIREAGDTDKAATDICLMLDDEIGLAGNGWFDDDEKMLERLEQEE